MPNLIKIELHFPRAPKGIDPSYGIKRITLDYEATLIQVFVDVKKFQNGQDFCFIRASSSNTDPDCSPENYVI